MHVLCLPIGICGDWQPHLIGAQPLNRQKRAFGHQIVAWVARNLLKIRSNLRERKNLFSHSWIIKIDRRFVWSIFFNLKSSKEIKVYRAEFVVIRVKACCISARFAFIRSETHPTVKWTTNDWPVILKMVFTHYVQISLQDLM